MDLANYINELLSLKGSVSVPGIGFFEQKRISGYYDEREKKFYPPHHEIVFDPRSKEDEELATYISNKKNISPASAKYFIEKYVAGLKAQASEHTADITGLGNLYYEYSVLSFKADKAYAANDPSFYGLTPVKADKGQGLSAMIEKPVVEAGPVVQTTVAEVNPVIVSNKGDTVKEEEQTTFTDTRSYIPQEVYEEDESGTLGDRTWVIILLIVIVALLCFGVFYQYKPEWFGRKPAVDTTIIVKEPAPGVKKPDTLKGAAAKDTTAPPGLKPPGAAKVPVDTYAMVRYEVQGGNYVTQSKLKAAMAKYEKAGLQPHILKYVPGPLKKITLGTYFDKYEAVQAEDSIKKIHGIDTSHISLDQYNPIKK